MKFPSKGLYLWYCPFEGRGGLKIRYYYNKKSPKEI